MPRGQPDYGLYTQTPVATGLSDVGEAAVRLGSINVFDRRGWVVWMDDFEAPLLKWFGGNNATGLLPALSTVTAFSNIQSVLLDAPAGAGASSFIRRAFPLIRQGNVGIEFWVQGFTKTTGYLRVDFDVYDGTRHTRARLLYDTDARTLTLVDPVHGNVIVARNIYMTTAFYFLPIKLVVDTDTNLYTRLLVGLEEIDISAYSLSDLAATINRNLTVSIFVVGSAANNMWMYIDNFIVTQNEP